METFRYLVRLIDVDNVVTVTTLFLCQAQDENHAMEQAETQYPGCEFLSSERIEYPEPY